MKRMLYLLPFIIVLALTGCSTAKKAGKTAAKTSVQATKTGAQATVQGVQAAGGAVTGRRASGNED